MPVHKVKGGYKWGKTGKTYPTKKQAERQARAIYANGYKGVNENDNNENIKISKNMTKKNTIKLTESELKKVITESVKKVLKEAKIGRGTKTIGGSSWSGDEYGGTTHYWSQTKENPYRSDAAMMLATRFEKVLGEDFKVEVHVNPATKVGYDERNGENIEIPSNYGSTIDFEVYGVGNTNIDDILYVLNTARKVFGKRDIKVYMMGEEDGAINISVDCSDIINKEPQKTMIPRNGGKLEKNTNGVYDRPFAKSNFDKPKYSSYHEN